MACIHNNNLSRPEKTALQIWRHLQLSKPNPDTMKRLHGAAPEAEWNAVAREGERTMTYYGHHMDAKVSREPGYGSRNRNLGSGFGRGCSSMSELVIKRRTGAGF